MALSLSLTLQEWISQNITTGSPRPPPTGVSACTAGLLCHRCWASTSSPTGLPSPPPTGVSACTAGLYAVVVGRLRLHRPAASSAADWCFRLHGWPIMPPLLGVYVFTDRPPRPPPTGVSACTAGLYAAVVGRLRLHRPACLRRRRLVFPPARLAFNAAVVGRLRLHRLACLRRRRLVFPPARLAFMPPLLGVYVFTDRPPRPPPTGASACTAGLYAAVVGRLRLHRPAASSAADWCFRLHGWPLCRRCWASTSSPTGRLDRRRLVFPPARLAFMPPLLGVYVFTDRPPRPPPTGASACTAGLYASVVGRLRLHRPAASSAADWCFRLQGWPLMPPLLGVYVFTDWLAFAAVDWCFRLHGWPLCRRCWASTSSPTGRLVRRRLVLPPARLAFMPPLLGVYVFTDRPPRPPPTGASACTAGLLCRRCWASTSSPTGRLDRRRLVFPPARLAFMPPLLGVYVFTDRLAFAAADWCFRLHGWPLCRRCWASTSSPTGRLVRRRLVLSPARLAFMPPLLGVYVFTDRPPRPPPTGVSACTAGLLCCRCCLRLHRPAAASASDWCFRLHGWPLCRRCWASTSSPTGRLVRRRLVFPPAWLAFMPPLLGVYIFTDRPPRPPPTGASACTAGLYAAVVGRLRLHRPAASTAADWCFRLHGWPLCRRCWASTSSPTGRLDRRRLVFPPARLAYYAAVVVCVFTDRPPHPPLTGVIACTAGLL
uniref:cysteine dioxygenase n=1 Tax=Oryza sativa TaxID=4530 RepID=Q01M44_ORYSA|nr:H0725E11.2 [Oryza sativa]